MIEISYLLEGFARQGPPGFKEMSILADKVILSLYQGSTAARKQCVSLSEIVIL